MNAIRFLLPRSVGGLTELPRVAARATVLMAVGLRAAESEWLLHWCLDKGCGAQVRDRSGQGLHGQRRAAWTNSPVGSAVFLDGTPGRLITATLPPALRWGSNSWTCLAWVNPVELAHRGPMNQRRLFAYGAYPDGLVVIDVLGSGALAPHLTYKDAQGSVRAAGLIGFQAVHTGVWTHVAVVCDRARGRLVSYLNGIEERARGRLYLYPPESPAPEPGTLEIGLWDRPLVVRRQVRHMRLEGLTFELAHFNGLLLEHCEDYTLAGCMVSRLAGHGITLQGGRANRLLGSVVHTLGRRGIELFGGDRATFSPGAHRVENCHIRCGRIDRTYTPAIQLEGVGHREAHNLLHHTPSSVLRIEGNDHPIEYNDVHSAVLDSDDQGTLELFGNPSYRGVIFRYNRFQDTGKRGPEPWVHGQAALRCDDAISGMLVYGNLFIRAGHGNFGANPINGGRDNLIDNNLFVDCERGLTGGWCPDNPVWRRLRGGLAPADFFTNALYLARYPELTRMLDPGAVNSVWRNVFSRYGSVVGGNRAHWDLLGNIEYPDSDTGFLGEARSDYRLRPDAPVPTRIPFRALPLAAIGLYPDPYRAPGPEETASGTPPAPRALP